MKIPLPSSKWRLAIALGAIALAAAKLASAASITVDANSGGSLKVTGGSATATGATINFSEQRTNGEGVYLWYAAGTVTVNSPNRLTASKRGSGTFNITGLKANTLYNVLLHGVSAGDGVSMTSSRYTAKAHFTTDAASGVSRIIIDEVRHEGPRFDLKGRASRPGGATGWTGSTRGGSISP